MKKALLVSLVLVVCAVLMYGAWIVFTFLDGGWYANTGLLHHHVARGDQHEVQKILRWNRHLAEEIDAPFSQRRALHIACEYEQLGAVEVLMRYAANLESRCSWGKTPLHYAASKGNGPIVRFLLAKGADIDARCDSGLLALHHAAQAINRDAFIKAALHRGASREAQFEGTLDAVEALLPRGADPDARTHRGHTALHGAVVFGNRRVVAYLLARGADVNATDKEGGTPIRDAVYHENFDCAKLLRAKGARLDMVSAAALGEEDFVRVRLKGANPPSKETKNRALYAACQAGAAATAKLLLDDGLPVEGIKVWEHSVPPLHDAVRCNQENTARLLLERGADVNSKDRRGNGPLYVAAYHGHLNMARLLIEKGADLNQRDNNGETVLHYLAAPVEEDVAMLELLLKAGANPNAAGGRGTPLQFAVNRPAIEDMLRRFGAK